MEKEEKQGKKSEKNESGRDIYVDTEELKACIDGYLSHAEKFGNAKKEVLKMMDTPDMEVYLAEQEIFEESCRSAEIRRDFDSALSKVSSGFELSYPLGFGFFKKDLKILAMLHKEGKHRDKIEQLLTDCNFHNECSQLVEGNYSGLL